jgi:ribosome-binding factor A
MGTKRLTRVNELLRRELGDVLYRVLNEEDLDLSSVTLTHVVTSSDLRHARVYVSVSGDEAGQKNVLSALYRHRKRMQQIVSKDVTLKYTPRLSFHLDDSIAAGDHVLDIIRDLEETELPDEHGEPRTKEGPPDG